MKYDYLIVGAGFYGAVFAHEMHKKGKKVLVIDQRKHIGGNCYTDRRDGINLHIYGPHIFNTNNKEIWDYINNFAEFNNFVYSPLAVYKGETYSLPFSMWTFNKMWNVTYPFEAQAIIEEQSKHIGEPKNLEEQAIKLVGTEVYEKLIKGYTEKQWRKSCTELPKEIIQRLPVRFTYDNNFYYSRYQGIPIGGYTPIFEKLLEGIEVKLDVDYLALRDYWNAQATKVLFTGAIDEYYNYKFGGLEYKTTDFVHTKFRKENHLGIAVINYTDKEVPYTRQIEHKHFEKTQSNVTWITTEYPAKYTPGVSTPMYPVNDAYNNSLYAKYKDLSKSEPNIIFGGRLAEYKYYNMDQVIKSSLNKVMQELDPIGYSLILGDE